MHNTTECQRKLILLGYLPALDENKQPNDDGRFGAKSLDAYNHYRATMGKPPAFPPIHLDALNADLFPEEQPAPKPKLTPNPIVQAVGVFVLNTILNQALKGTGITMDFAKISKAIAGGITGAIATTGTMAVIYLQLPPDAQTHFPSFVYSVLPWVNEGIGFLVGFCGVYLAPANKTT
jgi:hypothetical protein